MRPLAFVILIPWLVNGMPVTLVPQTNQPNTTEKLISTQLGCNGLDGKWYPAGSDISRGSDGHGWCYGTYCSDDGQVTAWDDWNCKPTITDPTTSNTAAPTTTPPPAQTTVPSPLGCFENGAWYAPGSEISQGSNGNGWCYGTYCTDDGQVAVWDDWNCKTTTADPAVSTPALIPTTIPTSFPTPSPTTLLPPLGCFQNGAWYEPGSEISRLSDGEGWCHGISCDAKGKVVAWDDWNCEDRDENTQPTTRPNKGCYYENKWHPQGSISEGSDNNGCRYGVICGDDGQVMRWDEFDCHPIKKE